MSDEPITQIGVDLTDVPPDVRVWCQSTLEPALFTALRHARDRGMAIGALRVTVHNERSMVSIDLFPDDETAAKYPVRHE